MRKLFLVTYATEVVVLAENESQARSIARECVAGRDLHLEPLEAQPLDVLPSSWDESCLPYGDDSDKTIGQWIEDGAAPKYVGRTNRAGK